LMRTSTIITAVDEIPRGLDHYVLDDTVIAFKKQNFELYTQSSLDAYALDCPKHPTMQRPSMPPMSYMNPFELRYATAELSSLDPTQNAIIDVRKRRGRGVHG